MTQIEEAVQRYEHLSQQREPVESALRDLISEMSIGIHLCALTRLYLHRVGHYQQLGGGSSNNTNVAGCYARYREDNVQKLR